MNFNEVPFVDKHYIVNFLGKFIGVFKLWEKFFLGVEFWVFCGIFIFFGGVLGVLILGLLGGVIASRFFEKRRGNLCGFRQIFLGFGFLRFCLNFCGKVCLNLWIATLALWLARNDGGGF